MKRLISFALLIAVVLCVSVCNAESLESFVNRYNEANKGTNTPILWVETDFEEEKTFPNEPKAYRAIYRLSNTITLYISVDENTEINGFILMHEGSVDEDEFLMYCQAFLNTFYGDMAPKYYSDLLKRLDEKDGNKEGSPFYVRDWGHGGHYLAFQNAEETADQ